MDNIKRRQYFETHLKKITILIPKVNKHYMKKEKKKEGRKGIERKKEGERREKTMVYIFNEAKCKNLNKILANKKSTLKMSFIMIKQTE